MVKRTNASGSVGLLSKEPMLSKEPSRAAYFSAVLAGRIKRAAFARPYRQNLWVMKFLLRQEEQYSYPRFSRIP